MKNAQLEQLATHDPLTGTLNHRALLEKLDETLVQAHETHTSCALLFLDLDHFEAMNDQYGHLVGDQVLCQFACLVASLLSSHDALGRWGGEEFVAVLSGKDLRDAYALAEAIRGCVAQQVFTAEETGKTFQITCSVGIAAYPQTTTSREQLLRRADQAMYQTKQGGRDKARIAYPDPSGKA